MARKKKQTVDYFPHMAASGKTLYILENSFGNDGYAFWFKLLELIASTDGHIIDGRNTAEWRFLLAKTRVSEETATQILNMLAELDAIDQKLWENKIIWSTNFVENVGDVYLRRKVNKPKKPDFSNKCEHNDDSNDIIEEKNELSGQNVNKNTQSRVKERKVKERKVVVKENSSEKEYDLQEIFRFYESNGFGTLAPKTMQDFDYWIQDFIKIGSTEKDAVELIIYAMGFAIDYNKRSYGYVNRVLQDWEQKRYLTVEDARAGQIQAEVKKDAENNHDDSQYSDLGF